ncbi:MAG: hypothetical protein LUI14_00520 [Lachnospiraceae bacterium]|nr:hypothetical protein [Lachnospiraceae bacterium]
MAAGLQAGAGRRVIRIPPEYLAVENFGLIHDPIHARAVAIRGGSSESNGSDHAAEQKSGSAAFMNCDGNMPVSGEETIILVSLEITSMPGEETAAIRSLIAEKTGVKETNIWVCVTHSFSSPHLLPDHMMKSEKEIGLKKQYREALQNAAVGAAADAVERLRPARLGVGTGECGIVANRDIELADGWWIGTNGDGPTNRTVTVLRLDDQEGNPIALISHFAIQSSVMDQSELTDGKKPVTSDIAGNACRKAEIALEQSGNAETEKEDRLETKRLVTNANSMKKTNVNTPVVMFLIGAAADQAPIEKAVNETFEQGETIRTDLHEAGFAVCDRLSERLKDNIIEISQAIVCDQDADQGAELDTDQNAEQDSNRATDQDADRDGNRNTDQDTVSIRTISATLTVPAKHMNRDLHSLRPTRNAIYEPDGESETEIEGIRIGNIALLGVKPELTCCTAADIMRQSAFDTTLICTLVNGASKYMADAGAYDRSCYEAQNSPFGRGAAEMLAERAAELLGELHS